MMVISEIADWKPINDGPFRSEADLREAKLRRKELVTSQEWKNSTTAAIFRYGFGFLDKDRDTLERYTHWQIKNFYDKLCELMALPAVRSQS